MRQTGMRRRLLRRVVQELRWHVGDPDLWVPALLGLVLASLFVGARLVDAWQHGNVLAGPFYTIAFLLAFAVFAGGTFLALKLVRLGVMIGAFAYRLSQGLRSLLAEVQADREPVAESQQEPHAPTPPAPASPHASAYAALGLADGASGREVKQAYRRLARRLHPDVSREPDAAANFRVVQQAYDALSG